jgi:colanic acid biosynthesis glycosyl transferase WcaI
MKVILANRYFHPDLAPTGLLAADVAFHLAALGYEVHAVTSRQRYDDAAARLAPRETIAGVRIHRVWTTRLGRATLAGRLLDYATFYVSAFVRLAMLARRGDVVIAKTDPPLLSVCACLAAVLRGARLVNWMQDVFPETATRLGMHAPGGLRRLRDWTARRAVANVVLGERMAEELGRLRVGGPAQVRVVPNWTDGALIRPIESGASPLRREWGFADRFVVGYAGNLGRAHDVDTFIDAASLLRGESGIVFSFVGGGHHFRRLARAAAERSLANVVLRAYVSSARLADSLGAVDVHLITLIPALEGLIVPSKFYGVAAAGRPTIFVGDADGEIGRLLRRHDIGVTVQPGDADGLAAAILALRTDKARRRAMGARARRVFETEWDKPVALARWLRVIEEAAG